MSQVKNLLIVLTFLGMLMGCPQKYYRYKIVGKNAKVDIYAILDSLHSMQYEIIAGYFLVGGAQIISNVQINIKNVGNKALFLKLQDCEFDSRNFRYQKGFDQIELNVGPNEIKTVSLAFKAPIDEKKSLTTVPEDEEVKFSLSWISSEFEHIKLESIFLVAS